MHQEPIFIQALWRSGSTYLWAKFRTRSDLRCFFEPLHESLHRKTREELLTDFQKASNKFGHTAVVNNYYSEFNIAASGGADGFERRFSLERYALRANDNDPELEQYIQKMIDYAGGQAQRAVMQFNRGVLRADWMKQRFGGVHIYLNRNPYDMFKSYNDNGYYIPSYLAIVGQNADHPVFAQAAKHFGVSKYDTKDKGFKSTLRNYYRCARPLTEQDKKDLVVFFWTLGLAESTRYVDMIVIQMPLFKDMAKACLKFLVH